MSCIHPVPEHERRRAQRAARLVDAVAHDGHFIGKWLDVRPAAVIPQGLRPRADDLPNKPEPQAPSAVYVGRLAADTGVELYFDALGVLRDRWQIMLPLHVYGAGPLEDRLRERTRDERLDVAFYGDTALAQDRIANHLLAFVSGRMTIQEAMARRRAVVAAYCNPIREDYVCGEPFSPFITTGGGGEAIAEQAAKLIRDDGYRRALVAQAFEQVRNLNWKATAEAYLQMWDTATSARRAAGRLRRLATAWRIERESNRWRRQSAGVET